MEKWNAAVSSRLLHECNVGEARGKIEEGEERISNYSSIAFVLPRSLFLDFAFV